MNENFTQAKPLNVNDDVPSNMHKKITLRTFEIYKVDGLWRGMEHESLSPNDAIRRYNNAHELRGKTAHFIIVSHDPNATYAVALEFAACIAAGKFSYRRIDLSGLGMLRNSDKTRKKGQKR